MRKSSYLGDKALVIAGLAGVIASAWAYLVPTSLDMYGRMDGAAAWMMEANWDAPYLLLIFLMWAAMMVAMMLPSAPPAILIFRKAVRDAPYVRSAAGRCSLCGGYLVAWVGFSVATCCCSGASPRGGAVVAHDADRQPAARWCAAAGGGALPEDAAQARVSAACRSPPGLLAARGQPGLPVALQLGLRHGLYCVGCCWALMLLLFVGGVMSLVCIGGITAFVLLEKLAPYGAQGGRLSGLALVLAGAWVLTSA